MSQTTKRALAASLKKLLSEKSLAKTTVIDIVTECEVNRQTFYYHFQDIYDLLGWMYKKEAVVELEKHATYNSWQEGFLNLFVYIQNNKEICLSAFHSLGRQHLESFLYSVTYQLIQHVVDTQAEDMDIDENHKNFLANFYTIAFIGIVIQWMQNDMKEQPQSIIESLSITVRGSMNNALEQYVKYS